MNDVTKRIRNYSRRQPITDKRFKFSNDLLARAEYVGNGKSADKRFDTSTEGLSMWISPYGIKTFYAFKKVKMFNKKKMKTESNNSYKKIFRFEDSTHRNLAAAKDELPNVLKELSASKQEANEDISFGSLSKDFLKNGMNDFRLHTLETIYEWERMDYYSKYTFQSTFRN